MKSQKIRGVEKMKNNGKIDFVSERYRSHGMTGTGKTTGCPTKTHTQHHGHDRQAGFTLVELVIVIAIVIILSVISVPIYRGYVDKAKWSEYYALFGTIISAQKAYYAEHGNFLEDSIWTYNETILGIDARGNKYFKYFKVGEGSNKSTFSAHISVPQELRYSLKNNESILILTYNISSGLVSREKWW